MSLFQLFVVLLLFIMVIILSMGFIYIARSVHDANRSRYRIDELRRDLLKARTELDTINRRGYSNPQHPQ
jgi:hypothetical protein